MRKLIIFAIVGLLLASCASTRTPDAGFNGIDISHYQGDVDWNRMVSSNRNIEFVYIKATEGATWTDKRRAEYAQKAHAKKLKVGFYHFFRVSSSGADQFNNFKQATKGLPYDLIPVLDIEVEPKASEKKQFEAGIKEFCKLCRRHYGTNPIIYTMPNFDKKHLDFLKKYKKWYCGRINENAIMKKCVMWQVAIKPIQGIYGNVDWDYCPKMRKIKK